MELILKFTDASESFAHGVEFGRLLERMEKCEEIIMNNGFPVRIENKEVIDSACNYFGYIPSFSPCVVEGWIEFIGIRKSSTDN